MTAKTKTLIESMEFSGALPRKLSNKSLSTNSKFAIHYGTYQQVVNALDAEQVPEHKVKGFYFTTAGNCLVIVHKH